MPSPWTLWPTTYCAKGEGGGGEEDGATADPPPRRRSVACSIRPMASSAYSSIRVAASIHAPLPVAADPAAPPLEQEVSIGNYSNS